MNNLSYKLHLMLTYKDALRTRVPLLFGAMMRKSRQRASCAAMSLQGKSKIEVAFLLTIPGMWKLDYLFRSMEQSGRYHPYIVIFPYSRFKGFSDSELNETVRRTEEFVKRKGFEYVIPYNERTGKWDDIKKTLNPDIVFFTTPYRDILPQYYYYNFKDRLTCYVPYAFQAMNLYDLDYNQIAINLYGINFAETSMHLDFARKYSRSGGRNFAVSGYPGTEVYLRKDYESQDVWKKQTVAKKRVIWAPHHTIETDGGFHVSTFLLFCDDMLALAEEYRDRVQFAFKPHQLLKFKLMQLWGEQRTNDYYRRWAEMDNCQLEESGYVDLFIHSDAMIHDSGSFTAEYMFLNKPVMYLAVNSSPEGQFNEFGKLAYRNHYHGGSVKEIREFIESVVIDGNDGMKADRQCFYDSYLVSPDGVMPSQRIMEIIESAINNGLKS